MVSKTVHLKADFKAIDFVVDRFFVKSSRVDAETVQLRYMYSMSATPQL